MKPAALSLPLAAALSLTTLSSAGMASAQTACRLPLDVSPAPEKPAPRSEISHTTADYNLLDMSWSPEFCRTRGDQAGNALQCRQNSFGFVLHGLWPSASNGPHPRFCNSAPPLSPDTVKASLCMTPSIDLLQHEWAAHGTCGWPDSTAYYRQASLLWASIKRPTPKGQMTAGALRSSLRRPQSGPAARGDPGAGRQRQPADRGGCLL